MRSLSTRAAGLVIVVLGLWGGLVPFVGPYFHYSLGPTKSWTYTTGRLWLDILPGVVAVIGGLMLINAGWRPHARLGALLALAAGIWFAIGPEISQLWNAAGAQGVAHGSARTRMLEMLGYHTGLGVVMTALAAYVLPRFPAVARVAAADRAGVADREAVVADRGAGPAYDRPAARGYGRSASGDAVAADEPVTRRERVAADEPAAGRADREPIGEGSGRGEFAAAEPVGSRGEAAEADGGASYPANRSGIDTAPTDRSGQYGDHTGPVRRRRRGGLLSMLSRR